MFKYLHLNKNYPIVLKLQIYITNSFLGLYGISFDNFSYVL